MLLGLGPGKNMKLKIETYKAQWFKHILHFVKLFRSKGVIYPVDVKIICLLLLLLQLLKLLKSFLPVDS